MSNVTCNNALFSSLKICRMHPTMARLYEAARKADPPVDGQSAVAHALGESPQTVKNWETRGVSQRGMLSAQRKFAVNAEWLATGDGVGMGVSYIASQLAQNTKQSNESAFLPGFEALSIPLLANSGSMGPGNDDLHDEVVIGRLTVSPDWARRVVKPTKLEHLRFIHGYGDSMEPTFADGDVLLVDLGVRDPKIDGVYVLEANDRIYIKRVRERMDGSMEISSDNPTVKTVDVLDGSTEVTVHGRVVWRWNGRKM